MGYLVVMVIRVMLFVLVQFFILYIVQVKSMCVPILRSIGHGDYDTSDRYFDKDHFETNQKSLRLPVQKLWLK